MDITATTEFSAMNLDGKTGIGWLGYIVIGGIAGWLASKIVKGGGSGILMNVVIGVVGAFGAGLVLNAGRRRQPWRVLVHLLRRPGRGCRPAVDRRHGAQDLAPNCCRPCKLSVTAAAGDG